MFLYHYYDKTVGPFVNLSDVSAEEAQRILKNIQTAKPSTQAAKRHPEYVANRLYYENILREKFREQGGTIKRQAPHYMVVEHSPWLATWFENSASISIPVEEFDVRTLSFTYGDSHPTFSPRVNDGKEYRKKLFMYDDILKLIQKYGLPQHWNPDGKYGPERYIEAHVWSDETIDKYRYGN